MSDEMLEFAARLEINAWGVLPTEMCETPVHQHIRAEGLEP